MEYRIIKKSEHQQMEKLRDYCFRHKYEGDYLTDYRNWLNWSNNLGAFEGDLLKGQVMILPLHMAIHGVSCKMGGIGYVGTYPENRNSGITKQLLIQSLKEMRANKQYISVLGPFSVSYYRKFGWEVFFDRLDYTIEQHQFPSLPKKDNNYVRFGFTNQQYFPLVKELCQQYALQHNGMLLRDNKWWERLQLREGDTTFCLYSDADGNPKGLLRYRIDDVTFIIKDFFAFDYEAEIALWQYVFRHSSNIFTVKGSASAHKPFAIEFDNPQFKKEIVHPVMIRIVDVKEFLSMYPFRKIENTLYIQVKDQYAEWNNKTFQIAKNRKITCIDTMDTNTHEAMTVTMDINTLSALLNGYKDIQQFIYSKKIKGNKHALQELENIIPSNTAQMYELF